MPLPFKTGDTVDDRYRIRRMIAHTADAYVLEAQQLFTRRSVAFKVAREKQADSEGRTVAEARLLTDVRHPCVVEVLDAGRVADNAAVFGGQPYLVMELVEGKSMATVLATRRTLAVDRSLRLGMALCDALACIHASNVVHFAISPDTLVLSELRRAQRTGWKGQRASPVKLLGFGSAARALLGSTDGIADAVAPNYVAPELLRDEGGDERSDIYALGMALYICLTGVLPFPGDKKAVLTRMAANPELPGPHELTATVPPSLGEAIGQAIILDPEQRFATALAFGRALLSAGEREPPNSEPPTTWRRRGEARASYMTPILITRADDSYMEAHCGDISATGMLAVGADVLNDGEKVRVRFELPVTGRAVEVAAIACWQRTGPEGPRVIGLQFKDLDEGSRTIISDFVRLFGSE